MIWEFLPDTPIPIGYYNEETMQWEDIGMSEMGVPPGKHKAKVSKDGLRIRVPPRSFLND